MAAGEPVGVEFQDVAPGLWIWRVEHPNWARGVGWEAPVTSTCVESGGEVAVLDPLAPPDAAAELWTRLDASPPTLAVVLKPDHVRHVDLFAGRYPRRRAAGLGDPVARGAALPALRALLELPFEHVIVSHRAPVHGRAAYERALGLAPWAG